MLITLEQLKQELEITTEEHDEQLTNVINQSSYFIENYLNRKLEKKDYEIRLNGNGEDELILPEYPVIALSSFSYNTGEINKPTWEEFSNYYIDKENGIISLPYGTRRGIANLQVNYTAGYEEIPADIQKVCLDLCTYFYEKKGSSKSIKKESVDGASIEYGGGDTINPDVYITLNKYKRYV